MTRLDDAPHYEDMLAFQCTAVGLPEPLREFAFCEGRRWRADLGWPRDVYHDQRPLGTTIWHGRLLVEVEGGLWTRGRHVSPRGFTLDIIKYNTAVLLGYRVLRFTPAMVEDGTAVDVIMRALSGRQ